MSIDTGNADAPSSIATPVERDGKQLVFHRSARETPPRIEIVMAVNPPQAIASRFAENTAADTQANAWSVYKASRADFFIGIALQVTRDNGNVHRAAANIIVSKNRTARGYVCNVLLSDGLPLG